MPLEFFPDNVSMVLQSKLAKRIGAFDDLGRWKRAQFLYDQPTFPSVRQSSLTMTNQPCKKVKTFSPFTYHVSSSVWKRLHYGYLNLINHQWTFNKKTWTPLLLMLLINLHISLRECNHLRKCFWNMQILHLIPENIEYHKCQLQYY